MINLWNFERRNHLETVSLWPRGSWKKRVNERWGFPVRKKFDIAKSLEGSTARGTRFSWDSRLSNTIKKSCQEQRSHVRRFETRLQKGIF